MWAVIIYTLALMLMILGLFFASYMFFNKLILPETGRNFITVISGKSDDEELYLKVYYAYIQTNLFNFSSCNSIMVVDYGVSDEMKEMCYEMISRKNDLLFCNISELDSKIIESQ